MLSCANLRDQRGITEPLCCFYAALQKRGVWECRNGAVLPKGISSMSVYILKRLLLVIPTFIGMTMVVSVVTRLVPGGPLEQAIMEHRNMGAEEGGSMGVGMGASGVGESGSRGSLSEEQLQDLKELYGLDKPWIIAYWQWLGNILRLDFGYSTRFHDPVIGHITERIGVSAYYGFMTFFITYLVSIPLGIAKAFRHGSFFDIITSIFVFLGYAIPSYVVAVILLVTFGATLGWFPMGGFMSDDSYGVSLSPLQMIVDVVYHSILPMIAYLVGAFAVLSFQMKSYLMEQMSADYVRTAVAKGVPYKKAVIQHALRNSIIPLAGGFGALLTAFIGGSFLVEAIFNIDGLALFGYESTLNRDYPVILATTAIVSFIGLLGAVVSDFAVAIIDPRVTYE